MQQSRIPSDLYQKALNGEDSSQYQLAKLLEETKGLSVARAKVWYERAAKQENKEAAERLAALDNIEKSSNGKTLAGLESKQSTFGMGTLLNRMGFQNKVKGVCHGIAMLATQL